MTEADRPPSTAERFDVLIGAPNSAIDSYYWLDTFVMAEVNRAKDAVHTAGGKGFNTARAVKRLGGEPLAVGIVGGQAGLLVKAELLREEIGHEMIWADLSTRQTATLIVDDHADSTVITEIGAAVGEKALEGFRDKLTEYAPAANVAVLSGSLPPDAPRDLYERLVEDLRTDVEWVCIDVAGEELRRAAEAGPAVIKINQVEYLGALAAEGEPFTWQRAAETFARLLPKGLRGLIVTAGAEGAYCFFKDMQPLRVQTSVDRVISSIGSGDTFMARLALGLARDEDLETLLVHASAAAAANTQRIGCGVFDVESIEPLVKRTTIEKLE